MLPMSDSSIRDLFASKIASCVRAALKLLTHLQAPREEVAA